jgi:actin-related protein 9
MELTRFRSDNIFLIVAPPFFSKDERERVCQIMFEKLDVPGLYIVDPALLAMFACNATNGLVIDIGYATTEVTAILESAVCSYSRQSAELGSSDVEHYLLKLLKEDAQFMQEYGMEPETGLIRAILSSSEMYVASDPSLPLPTDRISFTYEEKTVSF